MQASVVVTLRLLSTCGRRAPECSCSLVATHRLSSCGTWAPGRMGSVAVVHRLSCPAACGILVPLPGIEPASPALEGGFFFFLFFLINLFIYLFLAVLGLRFCARALSSCGERGPLFIAVRGPITVTASPVAEHRLQTHRLSSCGSRA